MPQSMTMALLLWNLRVATGACPFGSRWMYFKLFFFLHFLILPSVLPLKGTAGAHAAWWAGKVEAFATGRDSARALLSLIREATAAGVDSLQWKAAQVRKQSPYVWGRAKYVRVRGGGVGWGCKGGSHFMTRT